MESQSLSEKHETPSDLDALFDRELISREEYGEFWGLYWKEHLTPDQQATLDEFLFRLLEDELAYEPPGEVESAFSAFWRNL